MKKPKDNINVITGQVLHRITTLTSH